MKPLKDAIFICAASLLGSSLLRALIRKLYRLSVGAASADPRRNGEERLLKHIAPSVQVLIDAGANRGEYAKHLLRYQPAASVVCFEPAPDLAALIRDSLPGVSVESIALSDVQGTALFSLYGEASPLNSLYARRARSIAASATIEVPTTTLDAYAKEHGIEEIDLLKVDVEGAELAVLRGARGLLASGKIRLVQFEYGDTWIDARTFLKDLFDFNAALPAPYVLYRIGLSGLTRVPAYHASLEHFMYQNYLLVREADDPFVRTRTQAGGTA